MLNIDYKTLRPDAKGRVLLGNLIPDDVTSFKAYSDKEGRIILEPYAEIPAREMWLWKNPNTLKNVLDGINSPVVATMDKDEDVEDFINRL